MLKSTRSGSSCIEGRYSAERACARRSVSTSRTSRAPVPYGRKSPLCGSSTMESARSMPAIRRRPSTVSRKNPPYAPSTWNQSRSRAASSRERREIVDRARVGRAGVARDEEGRAARGAIRRNRLRERGHAHAVGVVGRDLADVAGRESGEHRRLLQRVVRLVGGVEDPGEEVLRQPVPPRGDERGEGGERAAARQDAAGPARQAGEVREPADDVRLDLRQPRRGGEHADVAVDGVGDQVRDRRVRQSAARDVGEVSGPGRVEALRDDALEQQVEQLLGRAARLRHRLGERARERGAALRVVRGLVGQRGDVRHDALASRRRSGRAARPGRARGCGLRSSRRGRSEVRDAVFAPGREGNPRRQRHFEKGRQREHLRLVHRPQLREPRSRFGGRAQRNLRVRQRLAQPNELGAAAGDPDPERSACGRARAPCRPRRGAPSRTSGAPGAGTPCPRPRAGARSRRAPRSSRRPRTGCRAASGRRRAPGRRRGSRAAPRPTSPSPAAARRARRRRLRRCAGAGSRGPSAEIRRARRAARSPPRAARRPATARAGNR